MKGKRNSSWRIFWRTVLIMLIGVGLIAFGFFSAMFVSAALV